MVQKFYSQSAQRKMNKLLDKLLRVLLSTLFLSSVTAPAEGLNFWIEGQTYRLQKERGYSEVLAWVNGKISGPAGYFVLAEAASNGYRQIYGGPSLKPTSWLELGVGIGQENVGNRNRRAAYFSADGERLSLSGYFENGASGSFHKVFLTYKATEFIKVGLMDQTSIGFGPKVTYNITKNTAVWGAVLRDHATHATNFIFAVNSQF